MLHLLRALCDQDMPFPIFVQQRDQYSRANELGIIFRVPNPRGEPGSNVAFEFFYLWDSA
jgi:hypothetical protein